MHNQPREPQPYEDCQAKSIQVFGWTSQGMDWGWGQGINSHHTQTCLGICRQRRLTWAKEQKNWIVAQWSKVLFSDESKFCISFGNQGPRVWRKGGSFLFGSQRRWSLSLPVLTLIFPALLPCLVRDSLCTALQTKILWYPGCAMQFDRHLSSRSTTGAVINGTGPDGCLPELDLLECTPGVQCS